MVAGLLTRSKGLDFAHWLRLQGITVSGSADIRRLRKSTKVEKAIAFGGRISDVADDHSEQTFRSHYAHGTTLRVIAGDVITTAQRRWLDAALAGPMVLDEEATRSLDDPGSAAALGLEPADIEALRTGELNMGVTDCSDPFASPVRPSRATLPGGAAALPGMPQRVRAAFEPQLLLFAEHLAHLALRLTPTRFHALWGQSRANLLEVLRSRTDAEPRDARRQIAEDGIVLQLPLASRAEFDA
ncbi:hypothetical protein [Plantactinospora sonchi]|uniref:Uncharacterized protein n=1 Tax=Plantactinospora sonchi TaxID=1544735 RepID=A0ABU7S256_9ACTN